MEYIMKNGFSGAAEFKWVAGGHVNDGFQNLVNDIM